MHTPSFPWLNRDLYPFPSNWLDLDGVKLHYTDVYGGNENQHETRNGRAAGESETLLFVHGTPSWSFDFRHVIGGLSGSHRCVALDHIGFGLSDKPADYPYRVQQHAQNLEALVAHLDLRNVTLVVHDFGGPIGLAWALRHPERVRRVVVLNSWLWSAEGDPAFQRMKRILRSPLLPFLYLRLNFSPRFLLPRSFHRPGMLSREIRRHYTAPFPNAASRHGQLAFARSLLLDQAWFEGLWSQLHLLRSRPALLIWGMQDAFVTPGYLDRFAGAFAAPEILRLEACGHFPQEEQAPAVTAAIQAFLRG